MLARNAYLFFTVYRTFDNYRIETECTLIQKVEIVVIRDLTQVCNGAVVSILNSAVLSVLPKGALVAYRSVTCPLYNLGYVYLVRSLSKRKLVFL